MTHQFYIKRCIQLAKNGLGLTYPNPLVGCVIVYNNKIIGEGWHKKAGEPHAEVNAIASVKNQDLLSKATIYVSLEPCSHFGKTPPCSDLIIKHKIPNVVIGCIDSFSEVSGRGIKRLKNAGCNVIVGVLEQECLELNKRFFTFHNKKRPYIFLKWAQTQDGFIAPDHNSEITWITNLYSRQLVHKQRSVEHSILIGTNTAIIDNPKLNTRNWYGHNPQKIVIDKDLKIPKSHSVIKDSETIIISKECIDFNSQISQQVCNILYENDLQSVIIEGGTRTLQTFIDSNLWDEAYVYSSVNEFKSGIKAPILPLREISNKLNIKQDILTIYKNDF